MGRGINWTKEYRIAKKQKYAFEENDEFERGIISDYSTVQEEEDRVFMEKIASDYIFKDDR